MNPASSDGLRTWLRRELRREARLAGLLLVGTLLLVFFLGAAWPAFRDYWQRINERLTQTAVHQHPLALMRTFSDRLHDSEYGWRLFAWSTPFNVTAARARLREEYPEIIGVQDGRAVAPRAEALRRADPGRFNERETAFLTRYLQIETYRFTWLYGEEDSFEVPDSTTALGQLATKIFGVPDAFLFTLSGIVRAGPVSIVMFSAVLAIAGLALRQSPRPSRWWLKLVLWLPLASALVWVTVLPMAIAAAIFGRFTPNTPGLIVIAALPLQWFTARLVLRLAGHVFRNVPRGASPSAVIQALTPPALAVPVFSKPTPPPAPTANFPAPPPPPAPLRSGHSRQP